MSDVRSRVLLDAMDCFQRSVALGAVPPIFFGGIVKVQPAADPDPERCRCAACCHGFPDECESLPAPEEPDTLRYVGQDLRAYELRTTGEWIEYPHKGMEAIIRYLQVELPEGESVPCGWTRKAFERHAQHPDTVHCTGWTRTGWARRGAGFCYLICDGCWAKRAEQADAPQPVARSRAR